MSGVPVLVTYDIHLGTQSAETVDRSLRTVIEMHERFQIKASFSFPAAAAQRLRPAVRALLDAGHEIGNHGLTHGPGEIYNRLPAGEQETLLRRATQALEEVTQRPVRFFRAPVFRISGATIRALEALGYEAELSMNSQRLGLLSSDPWNLTWLLAPRRPYHPSLRHPWRKGSTRLWEIPLSCALVPFMSNTMLICGLTFMKAFFSALYREALVFGGPIVFMSHPEELCPDREAVKRNPLGWRDLVPSRYGFGFRHALMERDPVKIAKHSLALLDYLRSFQRVRFLTVSEYVRQLNGAPAWGPTGVPTAVGDHAFHAA